MKNTQKIKSETDVKFYSLADLHFGKEDNDRVYKELLATFIENLEEDCKEPDTTPNVIFLDGDLYHRIIKFTEINAVLVIKFMERLLEISDTHNIQVRIIRGTRSHDFSQLNMLRKYEAVYPLFKIYETVTSEDIPLVNHPLNKDLTLKTLFLPEEYPKNFDEYYGEYLQDDQVYDTIQGHGTFNFATWSPTDKSDFESDMKRAPVWDADELAKHARGPIMFGHIHNYHDYKGKVYYISSYTTYSFSDRGDKGYLVTLMDLDSGSYNVDRVINDNAPTYAVIKLDDYEFDSVDEKLELINTTKANFDHVRIDAEDPDNATILKKVVENDPYIKVKLTRPKTEESKIEDKFKFLLDDYHETSIAETIQKFISVEYDKDLPLAVIDNIINSKAKSTPDELHEIISPEKSSR